MLKKMMLTNVIKIFNLYRVQSNVSFEISIPFISIYCIKEKDNQMIHQRQGKNIFYKWQSQSHNLSFIKYIHYQNNSIVKSISITYWWGCEETWLHYILQMMTQKDMSDMNKTIQIFLNLTMDFFEWSLTMPLHIPEE